ncbi:hypothetical protein [Streptomyces sp. NPDC006739]|uniref:hypothetical protein n=1 Tax=Streptomyces sp. NPDC006739 TaxID=3364763 RepID=UPI0036B7FD35
MADEHNKWLNRETAERLLSGESLEAVDASARDQAERLAKTLGALSVDPAPDGVELPGEAAALAAFRKVREAADAERAAAGALHRDPAQHSVQAPGGTDAGLFRITGAARSGGRSRRPRWARPARLALAAALAAGTLGGVAVAAGAGVLPTPFGGDDHPGPAASVSAAVTPDRPLGPPSPQSTGGTGTGPATPSGTASGSPGGSGLSGTATPSPDGSQGGGKDQGTPGSAGASAGTWWSGAAEACRAIRDGRPLGDDRKHVLEGVAGGSWRVKKYCQVVLGGAGGTLDGWNGSGGGGQDDGNGGSGGRGGDGDGRGGDGHGDHHQDGGASPAPTLLGQQPHPRRISSPLPAPSPSYSAL